MIRIDPVAVWDRWKRLLFVKDHVHNKETLQKDY